MKCVQAHMMQKESACDYDVAQVRKDFPILRTQVRGKPLVYLDNAATTQKPQCVIDTIQRYYTSENANVHRGIHYLSQQVTTRFDATREQVQRFFNAKVPCEIIFTSGATEGLNLIAHSYGQQHLKADDEILITHMEHHSNIVPWQILCQQTGAKLRVAPIRNNGELMLDIFQSMLNTRTKIVAMTHVSNALGTINPVRKIVEMARIHGAVTVVDGAQSAPHLPIDLQDLGCDFFVCSGHKLYGPTGIGILYGRAELLEKMKPYQSGGDMILSVSFEKTSYKYLPHFFEAGTPHIEGVLGLGAALTYLTKTGLERIASYEKDLLDYAHTALSTVPGLRLVGTAPEKAGVLSFTMDNAHPHDIGQILDEHGVAIRAGHHCAQPVMQRFGVPATARASLGLYNTRAEIDVLIEALEDVNRIFG